MKIFIPTKHSLHRPSKDFSDGLPPFDHMETPERIEQVVRGLKRVGLSDFVDVEATASDAVCALHDRDYVKFLFDLSEMIETGQEYLPPVFHGHLDQAPLWFRGGTYCREVGTPIGPHTVEAALNSAAAALEAAEYTLGANRDSFALCRPPGHHAGKRRYGGYSFFNNAYLAANAIANSGKRTAVLDTDYHVGDGSVEFASEAAPYFSLHADPGRNYPYLSSLVDDQLPHVQQAHLPEGVNGETYIQTLEDLLGAVQATNPDLLVLSLGFDTLGVDYIQDEETSITTEDFKLMGKAIASVRKPIVFILEGGYDPEHLTSCVENFFSGYFGGKPS